MENQRLLFAAFLSAVVLIAWSHFFAPVPVQSPPPQPAAVEGEEADSGDLGKIDEPVEQAPEIAEDNPEPASTTELTAEPVALQEQIVAISESRPVIETETIRAEFTNLGAQLVSFRLKDLEGEPLELIRRRGSDPYPFSLVVDSERSHRLNKALFTVEEGMDPDGQPMLTFRHRSERGDAEKTFRWTREGFLAVDATVRGEDDWGLLFGPGLRNFDEEEDADSRWIQRMATYRRGNEDSETLEPKKQEEPLELPGAGLRWVALEDNFFLAAAIPQDGLRKAVIRPVLQRQEVEEDSARFVPLGSLDDDDLTHVQLVFFEADGEHLELESYLGDKSYKHLKALPYGLEETVRWGKILGPLAQLLYYGLEWSYERITPNYGWAIVLVTCLIRLLFFPLTFKSQESMGKMQELNPKVQAIRAKYKSKLKDRQGRPNLDAQRQMNEEVMSIYKTAGVNPVSGCFPMLLQMPVFFAFYRLLASAVELRGAPWILWIQDLSISDPWFLLPILMGATSIAMQKMMPQSPDPMQRRIMQMMPLMFTLFAFAFPAGLVLYWLTNNLLTMAQQALLNNLKKRRAAAAA